MKTVIISGCMGFIGQNLMDSLLGKYNIIGIDNFITSDRKNLNRFKSYKNFRFIECDIIDKFEIVEKVDYIFNLACPASPPKYQANSIFTLETNFIGTHNLLKIAKRNNAIFIQASTSEVYGDPLVHPQIESYRGNVNTMGERSCYDEGKRIAESLCHEYRKEYNINTRIVRIFNTYGPGMDPLDGRVISNFIVNSIRKQPLTIYGDGSQTRSFCYIDDMTDALVKAMGVDFESPINLGNDNEISLNQLAEIFFDNYGKNKIKYTELDKDDPKVRRPNIERAKEILKWAPSTSLIDGLEKTYKYFRSIIK